MGRPLEWFDFTLLLRLSDRHQSLVVKIAAHTCTSRCTFFGLGLVSNDAFGGENHPGNGGSILERRPGHLGWIHNPGLEQVDEVVGCCIVADVKFLVPNSLRNDGSVLTGILPQCA